MKHPTPYRGLRRIILIPGLMLLCVGTAMAAETARKPAQTGDTCAAAVAQAERRQAIPAHLLSAISHAESGRWDAGEQATIAWPWTVKAEGTGYFLPDRAAAIAKVEALRKRGVSSIDVGCMQINLHYHADAFTDLDAAFDPATNTAYAAGFLADLKRETGSWTEAAARYHSATREFAIPYRAKVMRLWHAAREAHGGKSNPKGTAVQLASAGPSVSDIAAEAEAAAAAERRRREAQLHRQAVIDAYLARRAERIAAAN